LQTHLLLYRLRQFFIRMYSFLRGSQTSTVHDVTYPLYFGKTVVQSPGQIDTLKGKLLFSCYRYSFPEFAGYTDDVGWGCTIRSFQMLILNALLHVDEDGKLAESSERIQALIGDEKESFFSIQNIVAFGAEYGLSAGNWFSPTNGAYALQNIADKLHFPSMSIQVYPQISFDSCEDRPTLLVLSTRLGVQTIDSSYRALLTEYFKSDECIGVVGGKKTSSFYFVGVDSNDNLLYLDPHELRQHGDKNYNYGKVPGVVSVDEISPCVAIGFVIESREQGEAILEKYALFFDTVPKESEGSCEPAFFTVEDDEFCVILDEDGEEKDET
jgi:hypothetical protein